MALQTHINDIMMKRLTKAKATIAADSSAGAAATGGAPADGGYGPRYEAHISEMQAKLDAANNRCGPCFAQLSHMVRDMSRL